MTIHCRVLGPLRVRRDDHDVEVGTGLQSQVLAALIAAGGGVVSDTQLTDLLWPDDPPAAAANSIQAYVSRLRRALDPDRRGVLARLANGYRLDPQQVTADATAFRGAVAAAESAVAAGRPDDGAAAADTALALWTGTAYEGVPRRGPVAAEVARLEHLRTTAELLRLRALAATGRSGAVLGDLAALLDAAPEREDVWELYAGTLYRAGRQSEALEALRTARRTLRDDFGLDPGSGLRRLESDILEQRDHLDPVPAPAPAAARRTRAVPRPLTTLIGRVAETAAVAALVADRRLVTLTGIGGTGKTRLAIAVAGTRDDADGPWFVDLAALTEPDLLAQAVATTLGLTLAGGPDTLPAALAGRQALLVMDNCEHLLPGVADLVATLLGSCPDLRVLATSRVPLDVDGETVVEVRPLDPVRDAVALFTDRARLAPDAADDAALTAVRDICAALDGLPLAVELAAAQCRALSPEQIAEGLHDRFALLDADTGGGRHRGDAMAAAIRWSVDRLRPDTARLFRRLGVFVGGFDLAAATALEDGVRPVSALLQLVDAGLLTVDRSTTPPRYRMLEILRQYATDGLAADELAAARAAHRAWFAGVAREAGDELRGPRAPYWFDRLGREQANTRAALASALAAGDGDTARGIAGDLAWFWYRRAEVAEGLRWLTGALAAPPVAAGPSDTPGDPDAARARARANLGAGILTYLAGGDPARLIEFGSEAIRWGTLAGDHQTVALCLAFSTSQYAVQGDLETAAAVSAEGERIAREHGPAWAVADVIMLRGQLLRAVGDAEGALRALEEAITLAAATDHTWARASAMWMGAKVAWDIGRPEMAALRAQLLVEEVGAEGDLSTWLVGLHLLAGAAARLDQAETGAVLLGAISAESARIGFSPEVMDPVDSPRHVAAVREALPADVFAARFAAGRSLERPAIAALAAGIDVHADAALLPWSRVPDSADRGSELRIQ